MIPQICMSQRYRKTYDKASYELKKQAEGAVHDLVANYRHDPRMLLHRYDTLAGIRARVFKLDIGGGERLLAHYDDGTILLLDMGGHDITDRYDDKKFVFDLQNLEIAYHFFWPERSGFFKRRPDRSVLWLTNDELTPGWVYYLSDEQERVDRKIRNRLFKMMDSGKEAPPFFILGGPGTGKTSILLNLLRFFADLDPDNFVTRIMLSKDLSDYIERSTNAEIHRYRTGYGLKRKGSGLLLVDDPQNKQTIEQVLKWHRAGDIGATVIAFDPLQLEKALPDAHYNELVDEYDVREYRLQTCYRQKENVGQATLHVLNTIASSSPYSAAGKKAHHRTEHQELTTLANEISFINPVGYVEYYPETTVVQICSEVDRILQREDLMWKHYPGLLVIEGLSQGYVLSEAANEALWPLERKGYVRRVSLSSVEEIKGLEFQHVFVFIDKNLYRELQYGFSGTGRRVYDERRLFRIPFSRAKDSIVTFAL